MIEEFLMASRQLRLKKLRTLLILLGIAVGVATVVGVVSLGEGLRINAVEEIQKSRDLTLIEVSPGLGENGLVLISDSKVAEVEKTGAGVSPYVKDSYVSPSKTYFEVMGVPEGFGATNELEFQEGRWYEKGNNQIVLGSDLWDKLKKTDGISFSEETGNSAPVLSARLRLYGEDGRPVDREVSFLLAGALKPTNTELDNLAFTDLETARQLSEKEFYDGLRLKVESSVQVPAVRQRVEALGLACSSAQDEIDSVNRIMNGVTLVLAFFSSISLLVGGIMVVNTMVVSVYERTREIGISKALGASGRDILRMFLAECVIIGALGGFLGNMLGILFSIIIDRIGKPLLVSRLGVGDMGHLTAISPGILVAGFLAALLVSVLSGLYPAWRAAKLEPVTALRQL